MSYSRTIERRSTGADIVLPPIAAGDLRLDVSARPQARYAADLALDQTLADSFPASDPPSWTPGVARLATSSDAATAESPGEIASEDRAPRGARRMDAVLDVSLPRASRTALQRLMSLAGAVGVVLLAPLVILLVGLPIALAVRGIADAAVWLVTLLVG